MFAIQIFLSYVVLVIVSIISIITLLASKSLLGADNLSERLKECSFAFRQAIELCSLVIILSPIILGASAVLWIWGY